MVYDKNRYQPDTKEEGKMVQWLVSPVADRADVTPQTRRCPKCGYEFAYRHGQRTRIIGDWKIATVTQVRMRCPKCGITWTVYPAGIDLAVRRSRRAQQFGVFLYTAGLSYRQAAAALHTLDISASPSTVLRDVQGHAAREQIRAHHALLSGKVRVRRIGVDGTGVKMAGKPDDTGVVVVSDLESGVGLLVEAVDEKSSAAVQQLLAQAFRLLQPETVVTDEAPVYPEAIRQAAAQTDMSLPRHYLCAAHFRRNKVRRIRQLAGTARKRGWGAVVMELKALESLLRAPPWLLENYVSTLLRRYQRAKPPRKGKKASWHYRLKMLLLEIQEKASQVPGETNNRTEQLIGRAFKIRTRSMRGFKREDNRIRFLNLALALDARARREGVVYLP
jgi:transposase-like protein/ribosomal protein S27AE